MLPSHEAWVTEASVELLCSGQTCSMEEHAITALDQQGTCPPVILLKHVKVITDTT